MATIRTSDSQSIYDLKYPGAAIDAILDTAYDLQNAGYIFRGLASEYYNTPTERSWVLAGEGETGHGFTSPIPKGYIGVCVFDGTSWTGKLLKCVSIDSTPTPGSTNAVSSGGAYAALNQLATGVAEALDNMTFTDVTPPADEYTQLKLKLATTDSGIERIITYLTFLSATTSKAGLLSAADKAKLDALWSSGYQFEGIATPSTTPISTTSKIFYIATEAGTYFNAVTVTQGINILSWNGTAWSAVQVIGIDDEPIVGSDNLVKSGGVQNLYFDLVGTSFAIGAFMDSQSDAITEDTNYVYSKIFIPVKIGDIIHWKYSENGFSSGGIFAIVYNAQKEFIRYYSMNVANERDITISKTGNPAYMRFCFRKDSINSVYVAINNKIVLTYKRTRFFDIKDKNPLSVEEYSNVIDKLKIGETSVETTFTMTPGAAHSSQIDRLETLIPKGTIVAVKAEGDFKEGTANQIFYKTIGENNNVLYGSIKLNEYNLLSFDDTVISVGIAISAQDKSTNVIFTLTSEFSIIDELCNSGYRAALNNNINTLEATVEKASTFVTFYDDKYIPLFKKGDIVRFVFDNKESLTNQEHLLTFQRNSNTYSIDSGDTATTITIPEDVYKLTCYVRVVDFIKAGKIALRYTTSTDDLKKRERQYSEVIRSTLNLTAGEGHSSSLDRIKANIPANVPFTVSITNDTAVIEGSWNMQILAKDIDGGSQGPITFSTGEVVLVRFEKEITDFGIAVNGTSIINSGIANVVTKIGFSLVDIEEYTKQKPLREHTIVSSYNDVDIDSKLALFASHFVGTTQRTEPFLFFTDPHLYFDIATVTHGISELDRQEAMSLIQKAFNKSATKFVLCGGDWLTAHKGTEAYTYLGWVDGMMNGLFQDKYYMINGNHDNNYQGKNTYGDEGGETIPNQEMVNLLYSRFGTNKLYYSFKGNATRFYILDTGIDWREMMDEYRWEQIDWLANQLLTTSDIDIAIGMHIIANRGGIEGWMNNIAPMTDNVTKLLDSYNKKTSITLNGTTYNFAEARGTVHFIIAGHAHYDFNGIVNGIPVIGTMNVKPNYLGHNITFDLVLADYNANKLYLTRIGQGADRVIDII